jgi:hypothetical protein
MHDRNTAIRPKKAEMKTHLFFKFAPKSAAVQQRGESPYEFTREAHVLSSGRLDDAGYGAHDTVELGYLDTELLLASASEAVVAGAAIARRHTPLRCNPAFDQHSLQRRVKRALLNLKHLVGAILDRLGDLIAVQPTTDRERLEDEQVEGAWWDFIAITIGIRLLADQRSHELSPETGIA